MLAPRLTAFGLGLVLAACTAVTNAPTTEPASSSQASEEASSSVAPSMATETLLIGAALPMSGALSPNGKEQKDGYDLWMEKVNDAGGILVGDRRYLVEIKYYDYKSDTPTAVRLTEKLITEDEVQFLLGPYGSGATEAVSAIAQQYGVPLLSPSAAATSVYSHGNEYLFGTLVPVADGSVQVFEFFASLDPAPATIALLVRNDLFPKAQGDSIAAEAQARGIEIVYHELFPPDPTDLSTALLQIKAVEPDAVIGIGYVNDLILMTRQAKELQLRPSVFVQTAGPSHFSYIPALGDDANGITTIDWWAPQLEYSDGGKLFGTASDYADEFEAKYDYVPSYISASSSVCAYLIQRAVETAGTIDRDAVRDALAAFNEETFYGTIQFGEGGQNISTPIVVEQIQDGKVVTVFPAEVATDAADYPLK